MSGRRGRCSWHRPPAAPWPSRRTSTASPASALMLLGVTGTNGKTTITYLVEACAAEAGLPMGVIGTVTHRFAGQERTASHTTPESTEIQALLEEMRRRRDEGGGDGGFFPCAGPGARERDALRGRRLHQSHPGPPRLPRRHGGLLRGQAQALHRAPRPGWDRGGECARRVRRTAFRPARPGARSVALRHAHRRRAPAHRCANGHGGHRGHARDAPRLRPAGLAARRRAQPGEPALRGRAGAGAGDLARGGGARALALARRARAAGAGGGSARPGVTAFVDYAHTDDALARALAALRGLCPAAHRVPLRLRRRPRPRASGRSWERPRPPGPSWRW